jgi:17beta-estradiol 17-dehydrogenase/3beta-hydroxysteroid 3-dehydrogenase
VRLETQKVKGVLHRAIQNFTTMTSERKVAIVTGANSGVGYGIAERLLEWDCDNLIVVLACRNEARAMVAWQSLLQEYPKAKLDILIVDLGNCKSVINACKRICERCI